MEIYELDIAPECAVRWIENEAEGSFVNFHVLCRKEHAFDPEEPFTGDTQRGVASEIGRLSLEPLVERDYWVLEIRIKKVVGTRARASDDAFVGVEPVSFAEFKQEFVAEGGERRLVRLTAETPAAATKFREWRAEMEAKHG